MTVTVSANSDADLTMEPETLSFNSTNWAEAQTVTVTAGQDEDAGNDEDTLTLTGEGGEYAGVKSELEVAVDDDETPVLVLDKPSLDVTEGGSAEYTVRLSHVPTEDVTVGISGQASTDLTLSTTTLSFNSTDWNVPQTVTVSAGQDEDAANDMARLVNIALGGEYDDVNEDIAVEVIEDDTPEIVLDNKTELTVPEGSATGTTYTVRLSHRPTQNVTVKIEAGGDADLALEVSSFHFTPADWNTPQTVEVTAGSDDNAVDERGTLTHTASGGEYQDVRTDLPVIVDDDETAGVMLSRTSLDLDEGSSDGYELHGEADERADGDRHGRD